MQMPFYLEYGDALIRGVMCLLLLALALRPFFRRPRFPTCPKCGYDVSACPALRCPECASNLLDTGILTPHSHAELSYTPKRAILTAFYIALIAAAIVFPFVGLNAVANIAATTAFLALAAFHIHSLFAAVGKPPHCTHCGRSIYHNDRIECRACERDLRKTGIISPKLRSKRTAQPLAALLSISLAFVLVTTVSREFPTQVPFIYAPAQSTTKFLDIDLDSPAPALVGAHKIFRQPLTPWTLMRTGERRISSRFIRIIRFSNNVYHLENKGDSWRIDETSMPGSASAPSQRPITRTIATVPKDEVVEPFLSHLAPHLATQDIEELRTVLIASIAWLQTPPNADEPPPPQVAGWSVNLDESITSTIPILAIRHSFLAGAISITFIAACLLLYLWIAMYYAFCMRVLSPQKPPPATLST